VIARSPCCECGASPQVDSLCSARGDGESEAARRIKTQLMIEMQVRARTRALRGCLAPEEGGPQPRPQRASLWDCAQQHTAH
jgi:hypothetical protein